MGKTSEDSINDHPINSALPALIVQMESETSSYSDLSQVGSYLSYST